MTKKKYILVLKGRTPEQAKAAVLRQLGDFLHEVAESPARSPKAVSPKPRRRTRAPTRSGKPARANVSTPEAEPSVPSATSWPPTSSPRSSSPLVADPKRRLDEELINSALERHPNLTREEAIHYLLLAGA
jgi:hypothetical protein